MAKFRYQCVHFKPTVDTGATIFFITAIKSKHWYYRPVISRLLAHGFNVYIYDYPARPLLHAEPGEWVEFSQALTDDIRKNIAVERSRNPNARFAAIGVSVGSTLALHAAKYVPEIERIMFVTMYGSSAQLVWESKQLKVMKKKFTKANLTIHDAFKIFGPLEATTELDRLGQRAILLFASMDDRVISYSNSYLFIRAAIEQNLNFSYQVIGVARHSFAIANIFKNYGEWLPFLTELRESARATETVTAGRRIDIVRSSRPHMKRTSYV